MKEYLKAIWLYLKGKKSAIAATANAAFLWVVIKGYVPETDAVIIAGVLTAWTGIAVGDKFAKKEP